VRRPFKFDRALAVVYPLELGLSVITISRRLVALCALVISGCAGHGGSQPPADNAFLDMYDRPSARSRTAKPIRRSEPQDVITTGSSPTVHPYSPGWWAQERLVRSERMSNSSRRCTSAAGADFQPPIHRVHLVVCRELRRARDGSALSSARGHPTERDAARNACACERRLSSRLEPPRANKPRLVLQVSTSA
jgi:hypothetical protein